MILCYYLQKKLKIIKKAFLKIKKLFKNSYFSTFLIHVICIHLIKGRDEKKKEFYDDFTLFGCY